MSVNAACGGYRAIPEFDPGPQRSPSAVRGTPLTRLWLSQPVRGPSAPVAADTVAAYLGGADRRVVAVDLGSGRNRWTHRLPGPMIGGVLLADGVVYAATDRPGGRVHALSSPSGNELWSTATGYVEAPLAISAGRVIVLSRDGRMLALDRATGKVVWRRRLPSQRVGPLPLGGDTVLVTAYDSLYLVSATDGKVLLRRRSPGAVVSAWLHLRDHIVAGTGDSLLVALRPDGLSVLWRVRLDGPVLAQPVVRGDTIYAVTQLGTLYRIREGTPPKVTILAQTRWPATGAPALFGEWVLIGGSEGRLRAFHTSDGSEAWATMLGRPVELAALVLSDGEFLVLGGRGDMHRMRQ